MYDRDGAPSDAQVAKFQYLSPMLDSALAEMREFAKKKQDGIVSAMKIRVLNRLLTDLRGILEHEDSLRYLDLLSDEELPQNSDAVIVLGQYRAALESFKKRRQRTINYTATWITKEWIDEHGAEGDDEEEEYGEEDDGDMDDEAERDDEGEDGDTTPRRARR